MVTSFLLLFPLVVMIRSTLKSAFRRHWAVQVLDMAFVAAGVGLGIAMRVFGLTAPATHQGLGCMTTVLLLVQSAAGYQHHVVYMRLRQRPWLSHLHI
ncbi:hypothetical protein CDEST_15177 [Colletotrichum destructivum]|uniref:Cytochrome b561 domain-containing protein n=1 Tax=Colletotrichum destructivum TaxID=34406 RepID=A0AAX4J3M1_9PEZI|nr:hypothetical protein CDEST_15177 [Colletotrichum destructivum]